MTCDNDKESFGRRRRSVATQAPYRDFSIATLPTMTEHGDPMASSLVCDDTLGQDSIDRDTDLIKEIYHLYGGRG